MMKLMKGLRFGALLFGVLALASCNKDSDDDSSGGGDTPTGNFSAEFINAQNGEQGDWIGVNTTAEHDTITGRLSLTTRNGAGDVMYFTINDTAAGFYNFNGFSSNFSTYTLNGSTDLPKTTATSNIDEAETGGIMLTAYNTETMTISSEGGLGFFKYFTLVTNGDDELYGFMSNIAFSDVPVTRTGPSISEGDVNLSATINGSNFDPVIVQSVQQNGITIVGSAADVSLTVTVPEDAAPGTHSISLFSGYNVSYLEGTDGFLVDSGSMVITAVDMAAGTVSGTFTATLTSISDGSTVQITNGAFSVE